MPLTPWSCLAAYKFYGVHSHILIALGDYAFLTATLCYTLLCITVRGTLCAYLCLRVHQSSAPYPLPPTPQSSELASKGFLSCMCRWAGSWEEEEEGADVGTV